MAVGDPKDTREKILDAAERLFAEQGFAGSSLRAITTAAGANLAAVNYHFGSKESLIREVFSRRLGPLNAERLERLDRLEAAGNTGVAGIVEAFVSPPLRLSQDPERLSAVRHAVQMLGHATSHPDPKIRDLLFDQFDEVFERFTTALARALPGLSREQLLWRFLFMVGALAHTMAMAGDIARLSRGACDPTDGERLIRSMVPFVAAGFRAPVEEKR